MTKYWIFTVSTWLIFKVYTTPHHQPPRPSSTGLQAGYIPIPVIHEGGGSQTPTQAQLNPTVYSQRVPYPEHQQPFHRLQTEEWPSYSTVMQPPRERASPILLPQHRDSAAIHLPPHIRSQSPIVTQVMGERPPVILLLCVFTGSSIDKFNKRLIFMSVCVDLNIDIS